MNARKPAASALVLPAVFASFALACAGCSSAEEATPSTFDSPDAGTSSGDARDGGGIVVRPGDTPDAGPADGGGSCVAVESRATVVKRPIDFIVLPDESGSMGRTRDAVANAMQGEVRRALEAAGIDYKVVWHGAWPLPQLAGKVTYNNVALGSGSSVMFKPVLDTFAAWSPALRADALKVFVQFTDATSGDGGSIQGYPGSFDDALLQKSPALFGTSAIRKFTHHAFIGITEKSPASEPWAPSDVPVARSCNASYSAARPLEELARRSGGYRFPLCRPDLFAGVFDRIARTAIAAATVPCELVLPPPPPGEALDFSTVAVRYKAGDGTERVLLRARDASGCAPDRFLLDEGARRVTLCADACTSVKADSRGTLSVLSGCDPKVY
jgi:hypothetical protein